MTNDEFDAVWDKLTQSWPRWKTTTGVQQQWLNMLRGYTRSSIESAIDEHWQETGGKWEPDPAAIKKLAVGSGGSGPQTTEKDILYRAWFYELSQLEQHRELAKCRSLQLVQGRFSTPRERELCHASYDLDMRFVKRVEAAEALQYELKCKNPILPKRACVGCKKGPRI